MSRSEDQALAVLDQAFSLRDPVPARGRLLAGRGQGPLWLRRRAGWAQDWRQPLPPCSGTTPCAPFLSRDRPASRSGALAGKVLGVAKGLHLVRHQRTELRRRVTELTRQARVDETAGPRTR